MRYQLGVPPGGEEVSDLEEYVQDQFSQIEQAFQEQDYVFLVKLYVEPSRPRDGLVVYADGTEWDPGSGEGVYVYYGAAWNKLG